MDPYEEIIRRRKQRQIRFVLLIPVLIALLLGSAIYVFVYHINQFRVELELMGEDNVVLEYGQTYSEPGAQACFLGTYFISEGVPIDVEIEGQVDETQVGSYRLRYSASHERWKNEKYRKRTP